MFGLIFLLSHETLRPSCTYEYSWDMVGNVIKWNETGKKIDFTPFIDLAIDSLNKNEPLFLPLKFQDQWMQAQKWGIKVVSTLWNSQGKQVRIWNFEKENMHSM